MGEYATVKTSVWWDIENCGVPRGCDAERIVQNMSSALATAGYRGPISVSAYGDTGRIGNRVQHALSSTGVTLNHVPAGIKDASDKRILVDMLFWAIDNPPPANYLLISGDRDFSNAIHKLKMRRYNILLAQPPNVSQTLSAAAKSIWLWKSLVAGEPPLTQSPYISSASSRNIDDIDISKNIVSNSLDVTPHTNPQIQDSFLCDHQSGSNGNSDTQCKVNQPRENQSDRVFKPASKKDHKRSNSVDIGSTAQPALKKAKKSKGGSCTAEHSKPPMLVPQNSRPVPGQGMICFKCGGRHHASGCTFVGDCQHCGAQGHKSRVCKRNPDCIIKWEPKSPKPARIQATSSPGPVHILAVPPASQLPPAASSPSSVHMMAAAPASQSPPAASSPGSVHMMAADPASRLSPAASSPGSVHMTATPLASQLSSVASPPGSVHSRVFAMPTTAPLGTNVVTLPTSSAPCPPTVVSALLCFKCGGGHCATGCTWAGACRHCGQRGHMGRVCRENPDSIIKWEPAPSHGLSAASHTPSHGLSAASQAPVHMMPGFPDSQLPPGWMPSPGWFWQAALAMRAPFPGLPLAFAPPQPGVAVSFAPAHSGVYALPTLNSLGRPDMVAGGNTSGSEPLPPQHAPHG